VSGRVACLLVPRFAVAALLRAEPELRGTPLVVSAGGNVVEASAEAARVGAQPGLTIAQALIRHADLVVRPLDVAALDAARAALAEVARSVSPRVEIVGADDGETSAPRGKGAVAGGEHRIASASSFARDRGDPAPTAAVARAGHGGEVLLDVSGLERLFGSPAGIAAALLRRAERVGFPAAVGIADGRATARIAAGVAARRGEVILVEPGGDAAWLAPLPLAALGRACDPAERGKGRQSLEAVVDGLARLGVTRCGELAAMSADEVASRLGRVAAHMRAIAAGANAASELRVSFEPHAYVEGTRLEYGIGSLEALLFLIRGLLERVASRLALASLACSGLTVSLSLDDGSCVERTIGVLAPTRDVRTLLLLTRTALESAPPPGAVEAVHVQALPDRPRADQLDLFRPAGPAPEQLATTLARLAALCGEGKVGKPVPPTGHRPDAFRMAPFDPGAAGRRRAPAAAVEADDEPALVGSCATLALRALRPARAAQVFVEAGRIVYVRAPGLGGRAVVTSGPWRIDVEWWTSRPCRRDYYDVQLSDGGVYRLYRDLDARGADTSWFVDGCYD
jgi:protein ImuB